MAPSYAEFQVSLSDFLQSALGAVRRPLEADPRRAAPRIRVEPLHHIGFSWTGHGGPVEVPVANLSASGMALMRSAFGGQAAGQRLQGVLGLGERRVPVSLHQVHVTHDVIGCCFVDPARELVDAINAHLATELQALEMVRVEVGPHQHRGEGTPHWFHGLENSELYYVERAGQVLRFRLCFLANFLEGGQGQPVRFGVLTCDRDLSSDKAGEVHWLRKINAEQLSTTIRFVSGIPGLDPGHRDGILKLIC